MKSELILYEQGRQSWIECVEVAVAAAGQSDTKEFEVRSGYDRFDGIFCNYVQLWSGADGIRDGVINDLKVGDASVFFDANVGINDVLAVKADIPNMQRGFGTGGINVKVGDRIVFKTTDFNYDDLDFAAYTRKFYFIFSKAI